MIYQPSFRAYQRNYWPSDDLGQVFNWLLQRFLNCDVAHEVWRDWQREQRIALSMATELAERLCNVAFR